MSRFEAAHKFFANYLWIAQCFGSLPVCGITSAHHNKLKFKWRSFRTCYSLFIICFAAFNSSFDAYYWMFSSSRTNLAELTPVFYRLSCVLLYCLLFRLAMQWHRIMMKWSTVDALTFSYKPSESVNRKANILVAGSFIFQIISYVLIHLSITYNPSTKGFITLEEYMKKVYVHIFAYFNYSSVLGLSFEVLYIQWFFMSEFCEVFVIIVCLQLTARFANIRRKIKRLAHVKIKDEKMWLSVREDYGRLSELCAVLNDALGGLICMILANNTMMLLFFFYLAVKEINLWMTVYLLFALSVMLLQIISVCFCAANVKIQHTKCMNLLFCLPIQLYNKEVARLNRLFSTTANEIMTNGYFPVNRLLVLKLLGAGLSYELIILQYSYK